MNYNKLIAEFMGVKPPLYMEYHTSWDWLMPVVRKIENENELIGAHILSTDRDKTYKEVVRFIKDQACHIELQEWEKNNQIPSSDCCGAETTETEMGICPDCLEHCEFITSE